MTLAVDRTLPAWTSLKSIIAVIRGPNGLSESGVSVVGDGGFRGTEEAHIRSTGRNQNCQASTSTIHYIEVISSANRLAEPSGNLSRASPSQCRLTMINTSINRLKSKTLNLADQLFAATFQRSFAFSLLYEDSEVDNSVLQLDADSEVLSVTGAGCGVAGLLAAQPRRIDAVDTNPNHLAITAIKVAAAQKMKSYEEFYQLLGHGWHRDHARCLKPLVAGLPAWIETYWAKHHRLFRSNLYAEGLAGTFQKWLRRRTDLSDQFLMTMHSLPLEVRYQELERKVLSQIRSSLLFRAASSSPLFLLGHGINFRQMQRNLNHNHTTSMVDVVTARLKRLAQTNLETNWIAWIAASGHFNHNVSKALPPYLRPESHARSFGGPTHVHFRNYSLHQALEDPPEQGWSHFSLCDVLDWMPAQVQRDLLLRIARRGRAGAMVLTRSVEDGCIVDRLGLGELFTLIEPLSTEASARERSGLYSRVNAYRLVDGAQQSPLLGSS